MKALQAANVLTEACLGFKPEDIGTHSICSGAAIAVCLNKVPVYTIMLIGPWSSNALLKYIPRQVEQFSHNVSCREVKNQHITHNPNFEPQTSRHDLVQCNHQVNS